PVMATTPDFFTDFAPTVGEPWSFAEGHAFDGDFQAVLGARAAELTGARVGEQIYLAHGRSEGAEKAHTHREFPYTIVGILSPSGSAHDRAVFTDLTGAWTVHAHDKRRQ